MHFIPCCRDWQKASPPMIHYDPQELDVIELLFNLLEPIGSKRNRTAPIHYRYLFAATVDCTFLQCAQRLVDELEQAQTAALRSTAIDHVQSNARGREVRPKNSLVCCFESKQASHRSIDLSTNTQMPS